MCAFSALLTKTWPMKLSNGRFRQDLFYRINVIELKIPPLRERGKDILLLADHILNRLAIESATVAPKLSDGAQQSLINYEYPGNVRELENILERAFTLCEKETIRSSDLYLNTPTERSQNRTLQLPQIPDSLDNLEDYLEGVEKQVIIRTLESTRWNRTAAARQLGLTFRALRYRLKKLDLDRPE